MSKRIVGVALGFLIAAAAADDAVLQPKELAEQLQAKGAKPAVFFVGFPVLFHKHIPGATNSGQASKPPGLDGLKAAVAGLEHDREIVIYCGCCPYEKCPNVRPALALLKQLGFTRVKALMIPTNFATDWINQGYPIQQSSAPAKSN